MLISLIKWRKNRANLPVRYFRDEIIMQKLGSNIKRIRIQKDLSQEELSYKAELDISQIGRIERGQVNTSVSILNKIAIALSVELKELFDFDESSYNL